jgi:hypothetical protein
MPPNQERQRARVYRFQKMKSVDATPKDVLLRITKCDQYVRDRLIGVVFSPVLLKRGNSFYLEGHSID